MNREKEEGRKDKEERGKGNGYVILELCRDME